MGDKNKMAPWMKRRIERSRARCHKALTERKREEDERKSTRETLSKTIHEKAHAFTLLAQASG